MKRLLLGAILGYLVWTLLWLTGNQAIGLAYPEELEAFDEGGSLTATGSLVSSLVLSVVCSFLGGFTAARLGRERAGGAAWTLALLLLLTGLAVQLSAWSRMPVWYHLAFLALLLPVTLLGGTRSTVSVTLLRPGASTEKGD